MYGILAKLAEPTPSWSSGSIIPSMKYSDSPWYVTSTIKEVQAHLTSGPQSLVGWVKTEYELDFQRPALTYNNQTS